MRWKVTTVTVWLIWGSPSTSKAKQPEGRAAGFSGHANMTPRDPGRESGSPGSGLPLPWTNTDGVAGHPRSSCKAFIPEKLISGECVFFSIYTGVLGECRVVELKHGSSDISALLCFRRCVFVLVAASHCCWTPLWEEREWADAHTRKHTHSFCYNPNTS